MLPFQTLFMHFPVPHTLILNDGKEKKEQTGYVSNEMHLSQS